MDAIESTDHQDDANRDIQQPPAAIEGQNPEVNSATGGNNGAKNEKYCTQRIEAVCAVLLVLITGTYTCYARKQWRASMDQVKASQDANKLQARIAAYDRGAAMNPCWLAIQQEKPKAVQYGLSVWNIGNGRAYNVRISQEGEFKESEPPDVRDLKEKSVFLDEFSFGTPHPSSTTKTPCPDDSYLFFYVSPPSGYRERKLRMYIHGTIWYTDFSPQAHYVQFCLSVLPGEQPVKLCDTHRQRGDEP